MTRFARSRTIPLWLVFCSLPSAIGAQVVQAGPGAISGRVLDSLTRRPVSLVTVTVVGTRLSASTDADGGFMIAGVPRGTYSLQARRIGWEALVRSGVQLDRDTTVDLELLIKPVAVRLSEITVTPGSFAFMETGSAIRQTMSREDIESVPQFGEDIFRAVNRLPGLTSGDYTASFSIRGGRQDETLIVLDGIEIYEPYHLKDFNEGAISIVDVEAIDGVELMTGGFPAKYGNKRSGVFSMTARDARGQDTKASIGLSFINARAMAQGTFARDRGSWFFSARRGYLDLIFGLVGINDLPSPVFYDVFSKVRYDLHPRHTLSFDVLHARDSYTLDGNASTGFNDSIKTREVATNRYGNSYAWVTLKSLLGDRLTVTSLASGGLVTTTRYGSEFNRASPDTIYAIANVRDFHVLGFKQDWLYELSRAMVVEFGYDLRRFDADYSITNRVWKDPDDPSPDTLAFYPQETRSSLARNGTLVAAYLSNRVQLAGPLTVELGLRYDRASYTDDSDFSPRVNTLLRLAEGSNLRLGWGHYRQTQAIADLAALDGLNRYFPSELSRQWTLGFEHLFHGGGAVRVEGYFKRGSSLRPVYRNWKGAIDVFPETDEDRILVYPEGTKSRGIEVYLSRDISRKIGLRGSYALAVVDEEVDRIDNLNDPTPLVFDRVHPSPQDQRHVLHLDITYRPNPKWSIVSSYAFHTGWPATLESTRPVTGPNGETAFPIKPDTILGSRLPSYQRLDVRMTKRAGNLRFFIEVVNLTNHENVFGYDYFLAPAPDGGTRLQRDPETWFTILPSLGVSWSKTF